MCSGCAKKRQAMLDRMTQQPIQNRRVPQIIEPTPAPLRAPVAPTIIEETPEETEKRVIGIEPSTISFNKFNI